MVAYANHDLTVLHRDRPACPWYGFGMVQSTPHPVLIQENGNGCPFAGAQHRSPCYMQTNDLPVAWLQCPVRQTAECLTPILAELTKHGQVLLPEIGAIPARAWYAAFLDCCEEI
jgi:hypothetical protein